MCIAVVEMVAAVVVGWRRVRQAGKRCTAREWVGVVVVAGTEKEQRTMKPDSGAC